MANHLLIAITAAAGLVMAQCVDSAQRDSIRVAIPEHIAEYPMYLKAHADGSFSGPLLSFTRCALNNYRVEPVLAPVKRLRHKLTTGDVDMLIPTVRYSKFVSDKSLATLQSSKPMHRAYVSAITKDSETLASIQSLEDIKSLRLGLVHGSYLYDSFLQANNPDYITTTRVSQLFKLLLTNRIDMAVITTPWSGDHIQEFQGHALTGTTIFIADTIALFSVDISKHHPEIIESFDDNLAACRHHFASVEANNPLRRRTPTQSNY